MEEGSAVPGDSVWVSTALFLEPTRLGIIFIIIMIHRTNSNGLLVVATTRTGVSATVAAEIVTNKQPGHGSQQPQRMIKMMMTTTIFNDD